MQNPCGVPGCRSCQACYGGVTTKYRFGHCRISGKCARLRTIERRRAQRVSPLIIFLRFGQVLSQTALACRHGGHEKPVRTQCLTSAALLPVPHPNSLSLLSPIPIARFCRSLANHQLGAQPYPRQPVDTKALNHHTKPPPECLASSPGLRMFPCHSQNAKDAPSSPAPLPGITGMSRKDA